MGSFYQLLQVLLGSTFTMKFTVLIASVLLIAVEGSYYGYGGYGSGYGVYGGYGYGGYGDYGYGYGYPSYGHGGYGNYGYGYGYGHGNKYKRSVDQQVHVSGNVYGGPVVGAPSSAYGSAPAHYPASHYGYPSRYEYTYQYYPYSRYPVHYQAHADAYAPQGGYAAVYNRAIATPFMYSYAPNYGPYGERYYGPYWPYRGM